MNLLYMGENPKTKKIIRYILMSIMIIISVVDIIIILNVLLFGGLGELELQEYIFKNVLILIFWRGLFIFIILKATQQKA